MAKFYCGGCRNHHHNYTLHFQSRGGKGARNRNSNRATEGNILATYWHPFDPTSRRIVNSVGGFKFNQKQRERDEVIENKQAQDNAIQAYLDQMSDLLVNQHLRSLPPGSDIHRLAEARTSEVLLGLDGERKRRPLKLVYGLGLIKKSTNAGETDGTLLDLQNLSLDHADLTELTLRKASLRFADLRGANLQGADLSGSDLTYADLRGANLTNA